MIGTLRTTLSEWLITQESVQPVRFVVWLVGGTYGRSWDEVAMLLPWCVLGAKCLWAGVSTALIRARLGLWLRDTG